MSANGLEVFDKTLHITNTWLGEIMAEIGTDRHVAWHVLGTVLRAMRDRMSLGLAVHLGAQLPLLIRGVYYDQWNPAQEPAKWRSLDEFLNLVSADFRGMEAIDPAKAAQAVFRVLNHYVDPGQVENVRKAMPEEVRAIWPESGPPGGRKLDSAA
jgi:uncharacterized protein (DUF2267 family)